MGLNISRSYQASRVTRTVSMTVSFVLPLAYCLVPVAALAPVGALVMLLANVPWRRSWRAAISDAVVTALGVSGAGLLAVLAGLPSETPDTAQIWALAVAALLVNVVMNRSLALDAVAGAGCGVAFAGLVLRAADTGQVVWWLLALIPFVAQYLDAGTVLTRESTLSIAERLLLLPHLIAAWRTTAEDLRTFAEDLRRILDADRLWLSMTLPCGAMPVMASATERGLPAEEDAAVASISGQRLSGTLPRRVLPAGWRAGVRIPLLASDGRPAGDLILGWTRRSGPYRASRVTWGVLGGALTSTARALGAFWANVWAAYDLERERSRLSAVIDHSDVALLALDPDGRVVIWNAAMADLVGVPADRAIGERAAELFSLAAEDGSKVYLADGLHGSVRLATLAGRLLSVQVSSSVSEVGAGGLMSTVFVDKSAQRELEYMRHLLLNSVRHELHGPLTSIRGHAQLLDELLATDAGNPQETEGSLAAIQDAVETMHHVLGDLLLVAGEDPSITRPVTTLGTIDVVSLVARTLRSVPSVTARQVVNCPTALSVRGDPVRLRQCLLVVLGNAEKYAPAGKVRVTVCSQGAYGVIDIADEGPGIPPGERTLVLAPYYRGAAARDLPGSGMGLHVAHVMMTAMNGRIELDTAPSGGLRVSLWLPLAS